MAKKPATPKSVESFKHDEATRKNIPTAEYQAVLKKEQQSPVQVAYERRNRDLDPQLIWRGKDEQDWSDLVVPAPPIYIQEKVHPKALVDDLLAQTKAGASEAQFDLFNDFNGIPKDADKTEFYAHDQNWSNRMILGDSLQVMASLAEREGLRGGVQCIYFDPPYGIKFNSNFQWSTTDKAGTTTDSSEKISREPEQVKAFRDTWRDGIHSYLTYLRDRLTVARDLLSDRGSIFVQISDENEHRLRAILDEVFGDENFIALIPFRKKRMPLGSNFIEQMHDFLIWYAKDKKSAKSRPLFEGKLFEGDGFYRFAETPEAEEVELTQEQVENHSLIPSTWRVFWKKNLKPSGPMESGRFTVDFKGKKFPPPKNGYSTTPAGMAALIKLNRITVDGTNLAYKVYTNDYPVTRITAPWIRTIGPSNKVYVVQTHEEVVKRCVLMVTDPGDLVLDPTCGSGTAATVSEQWGRRWITIDTSRVALALARARIMGARYPFYLLADSHEGQLKEAEISQKALSSQSVHGNIRHGFVYERVPHITLGAISRNAEIDVIWEQSQAKMEPLRIKLNAALKEVWQDWEIPREADNAWPATAKKLHDELWQLRVLRQQQIDRSIAAKADFEFLYDKPYENKKTVRVAGPFTVESLSPHRTLGVDENDELIDSLSESKLGYGVKKDFAGMVLENLKIAGVQQAHKADKIVFIALNPWPGELVCAEGRYMEGTTEKRAAIFIGPEFGTVQRADLVSAAREAGDGGFDVLIACAFNFEAHTTEFANLGRIPVLKARMNADLHMSEDLKNTGKGNLFVIFGEPDIDLLSEKDGKVRVKVNGVDVFDPSTGEVRSDGADGIACWFIDTDYNEESFFVRHAYFLGANDPYTSLKTTLKAEIDADAWASLHSDTSRPFDKPKKGRIAVKVINHLGDEVMKVFKV